MLSLSLPSGKPVPAPRPTMLGRPEGGPTPREGKLAPQTCIIILLDVRKLLKIAVLAPKIQNFFLNNFSIFGGKFLHKGTLRILEPQADDASPILSLNTSLVH